MSHNSSWNGPGSVANECIIRGKWETLHPILTDVPSFRDGGAWARAATELDIVVMNFDSLFDNYGTPVNIKVINKKPQNKDHYEENDTYKIRVSDLGMEQELTIDASCTYMGGNFVVTLKKVSGDERAFKNVCGYVEKMMTGKEYTKISEKNENNNNNNGYGQYGRYRRGGRKTRRSRHSCRHRKTKSRRSRK